MHEKKDKLTVNLTRSFTRRTCVIMLTYVNWKVRKSDWMENKFHSVTPPLPFTHILVDWMPENRVCYAITANFVFASVRIICNIQKLLLQRIPPPAQPLDIVYIRFWDASSCPHRLQLSAQNSGWPSVLKMAVNSFWLTRRRKIRPWLIFLVSRLRIITIILAIFLTGKYYYVLFLTRVMT